MNIQFDARHISTAREFQPQMTNWFLISFTDISDDITLNSRQVSLPSVTTPAVELPYGNSSAKVTGQVQYSGGNFVVRDAILKDIEEQILKWHSQVYDPNTGEVGWVDEYKRTATVVQYGPHGEAQRIWKFFGVWPETVDYGTMDMSSSNAKEITISFAYDWAVRKDTI